MPFARAARLDELPPYLFIEIDRMKSEAIAAGRDVISFGVGDPDKPTPGFIVDRMRDAVAKPANHPYALGIGSLAFRKTAANFMDERFGVKVDPKTQVIALIGTKEGLGHLPLAVINPGDVALVPSPGYPVYQSATIFAGGTPHVMPLLARNGFLPNLDEISEDVLAKTRLMFINYPNNPTGAPATLGFYEKCVALAKKHDFLICSDAAYTEVYFDDADKPHSIFEVPGAIDVAIELHSLSKTFNMTGWRVGFAVGHADALSALAKIKGNMDSGIFGAVQESGIAALEGIGREEIVGIRKLYKERADTLVPLLRKSGFEVEPPRATFYIWAKCPKGYDSMTCAKKLLDEQAIVAIPGVGFGKHGDDFVRFALTVDKERILEAGRRIAEITW
ncbi:MAG: LL-diaminopimelate aminotransferase [Phycisphaerales bacterium]|nr:LL-diaminopimelate aminotransferase [Phycisphaerales bacterium]MCB9857214.1 LL-diaminopimelate aminotransferase [Phycisphaerales bacterium]MCB9863073.1 LL-diaminopimelate aminotransferase [Phycisphaerales bacterium]